MNCSLHRGAERDLLEAARFYRDEGGAKLSERFLDEFERITQLLIKFPGIGAPADPDRRVHPLRGFPYSVIYSHKDDGIRILVVRGHFRDPGHGESRV